MISLKEAMKKIEDINLSPKGKKRVFLMESLGEILACDIVAKGNSPEFETASMDGYACKFEDLKIGHLKVKGILPAGSFDDLSIDNGECIKTFTGSIMSKGCDTLIPIENVTLKDDTIKIDKEVAKGFSVRKVGENYKDGEVLITKGTKIGYPEIGVMATLNISQVEIYQKPVVGIIATGSEIVDLGDERTNPSQIRSSNHFTIEAMAKQNGADTNRYTLASDNKDEIKHLILESLKNDDIVVTTGGVSVGDFDFVKDILKELEVEYIIDKVAMKPGRHIKVVKIGEKFIFALPGFPYSSTVTFKLFALPIIWKLKGENRSFDIYKAKVLSDYNKKTNFTEVVACSVSIDDGLYRVSLDHKRDGSSAILTNLLDGAGYFITDSSLNSGDKVDLLLS
jgi:molybdopterin molybdotransferase